MQRVAEMLQQIAAKIRSWDGENLNEILPAVQQLHALRMRVRNREDVCDEDSSVLDNVICRDDAASIALIEAGERRHLPWPSPFDEEACDFAWVVDRQGQYLTRDVCGCPWYLGGDWYIDRWTTDED